MAAQQFKCSGRMKAAGIEPGLSAAADLKRFGFVFVGYDKPSSAEHLIAMLSLCSN